jgi:hypothetical protein
MKNLAPFTTEEVSRYSEVRSGSAILAGACIIAWAAFHGWEPALLYGGGVLLLGGGLSWYFNRD